MDNSRRDDVAGTGFPGHLAERVRQNLKVYSQRDRRAEREARYLAVDGKGSDDWRDGSGLQRIILGAQRFAAIDLRLPEQIARDLAAEEASSTWDDAAAHGRVYVADSATFYREVCERVYKAARRRRSERMTELRTIVRLDQGIGEENDASDAKSVGLWGHAPAEQFHVVELSEVSAAIGLLPDKYRAVMKLLRDGNNASDISEELHIPIHVVFRRIKDAREYLNTGDLVGMARDLSRL